MRGYARIWRRLWLDEKFRALPPHPGQFVVLYLLSCASNRIGIFTVSVGDLAERLDLRPSEVSTLVGEICAAMEWSWDGSTRTVWIASWWRWNPPESPKALMGYMRELRDLPASEILASYLRANHGFADSLREAYRKATDSLRVRARVRAQTEPEPEPEPEPEEDRQKAEPDPPPATPAGWLGATAPEPNREPEIARELIAQLQLDHPSVDVDLVAAKVLAAYRSGQVKHTDRALRAWVAQAARKGTDQRPPERPQDFRARFERRLDREPHLGPEQRSTLWLKAQAAVRRGHGEELVLEAMMRSWVAELSETMRAPPPVGWASP